MKIFKFFFFLFFLLCVANVHAQQMPLLSHYYLNPLLISPSLTGTSADVNIFLVHREQWKGISGAPVTNGFTTDLGLNEKVGVGLSIFEQKFGISKTLKAKGLFGYHLPVSETNRISFGVGAGFVNNSTDPNKVIARRDDDPLLLSQTERSLSPDFDAAVAFRTEKFAVGISGFQLQAGAFNKEGLTPSESRRFNAFSSYSYLVSEESEISIIPLAVVNYTQGSPIDFNVNTSLSWKNTLWIGASYRSGYATGINAALQFKGLKVGYCYEIPLNSINSFAGLTHEIMIGYAIKRSVSEPKEKEVTQSPQETANDKAELQRLIEELEIKEDQVRDHEKKIFSLIDSLYIKANEKESRTNQDELLELKKTQEEVNKIKEELRIYKNEKNVELFKLRRRIDELKKKTMK